MAAQPSPYHDVHSKISRMARIHRINNKVFMMTSSSSLEVVVIVTFVLVVVVVGVAVYQGSSVAV